MKYLLPFVLLSLILSACGMPVSVSSGEAAGGAQPAQSVQVEATSALALTPSVPQPTDAAILNLSYPIVDTAQTTCYSDNSVIPCPEVGSAFSGQDGSYQGASPSYRANGDGTVSDLVTGLMWTWSPDLNGDGTINMQDKLTFSGAQTYADGLSYAGYDDWRVPGIKELYSLMNFNGYTGVGDFNSVPSNAVPYLDTNYFEFGYGDTSAGERYIDAQFATTTKYVSTTMNGAETMFGVNFADGRIKGYGLNDHGNGEKTFYVLFVRGASNYGVNSFVDNGNGTIADNATSLTWMQIDSGALISGTAISGGLNWQEALNWCESLDYAGATDWRLPDIKELHSIVDYTRSPDTTNSAAIDPLFQSTYLTNGINNNGYANYGHYWSSTTHLDGMVAEARAAYIAFGEAQGLMNDTMMDVHGAGAQRSDTKSGDPSQLPVGQGPQGDVQSIYNLVRCVRGGVTASVSGYTGVSTPSGQGQPSQGQPTQGNQLQQSGQPQGNQPPQEAIDACSGLAQGAACSINTPNGLITGTCGTPPNSSQMACMPAGGPPSP